MRPTDLAVEGNSPSKPGSKGVPLTWKLVCVGITALALYLVFRKIPLENLLKTLQDMKVGWFIASIALYGSMFFPAAWRWHLALRINDSAVNLPASLRFSIIGHFFYLILFGGTAGDAAKAAVYGRRYQKPLPHLLASVWLDRLMGSGALLTISASALIVAALHGGLDGAKSFSIRSSAWWLLLLIPAVFMVLFFLKRDHIAEKIPERFRLQPAHAIGRQCCHCIEFTGRKSHTHPVGAAGLDFSADYGR
jgi:uncharacterized membrane protein YbhN (UPF0104 family)